LTTGGGLVFMGGTDDRFFRAFDATTGEVLWQQRTNSGIIGVPSTYEIDGVQYVAVAAGLGGGLLPGGLIEEAAITRHVNEGRILVFKLGARAPIPPSAPRDLTVPAPPPLEASAEELRAGKTAYNRYCIGCHGPSVKSSWVVPDLRYLSPERHEAFESIVYQGALVANGMPRFDDIDPAVLPALHSYVIAESQKLYEQQNRPRE
jgi:quinohemoprotein ethanol dehydrogenase